MTTITVRLSENEIAFYKRQAEFDGLSLSDFIKKTVNDKLEDEYDLIVAEEAYQEYLKNPVPISHDGMMRKYGLLD